MTASIPTRLRNLQLLRAMAASAVVLQHAIHDSWSLGAGAPPAATGRYFFNFEYGVDIFFVISGFIMAHTMAGEFGTPGAPQRFLRRRFARIIPLYWLLTTVLVFGSLAAPWLLNVPIGDTWHVVSSYLFIPDARVTGEIRPVLALGWTLNFEMFFYLLFAMALTLPIRRGLGWLVGAMVSLALFHVLVAPTSDPLAYWTNPIILEFLFGIAVAMLFRSGVRTGPAASLVLVAVGLMGFIVAVPNGDESNFMLRFVFTGVPAALLVAAAALGPSIADKPSLAWGVAVGNASYSLYLVHPFVVRPLRAIWSHAVGARLPAVVYVAVCCLAAVIVALIVHRLLERPLTKVVQSLARRRDNGARQRADGLVPSRLRP